MPEGKAVAELYCLPPESFSHTQCDLLDGITKELHQKTSFLVACPGTHTRVHIGCVLAEVNAIA